MRGHQAGFCEPRRPMTSSWGQQEPQKGAPWGRELQKALVAARRSLG